MGDWYKDKKRSTYVGTYDSDKDARKDTEEAARHGWVPQATASLRGERGMVHSALLPFGHGKEKVTITFVRLDPAQQLVAYAELLEKGAISQKEFDEQKKRLMKR